MNVVSPTWLLLIYTVPAQPTRKRAYVWREVKKTGAVYLRDGVCALPDGEATADAFRVIAAKVEELEGAATLAENCRLPATRSDALIAQMVGDRDREYADLRREARLLAAHFERERSHRLISGAEFQSDLQKLKGWYEQIRSRDYFTAREAAAAASALAECEEGLGNLLVDLSRPGLGS